MSVTASEDALELLCCENLESDGTCRAVEDKRLLDDERVLKNMMDSEIQHMPTCNYFSCVQNDLTPRMRKILADWMLEVCEDQGCSDDVFPLSMNLVDRFLCSVTLSKSQLQLLGTVALFIASKIKETRPLSAEVLVELTDRSVSLDDVMQWELFVLNRLKWDLNAVTAHDFVDYLVRRLDPLPSGLSVEQVKAHAKTFITLCATVPFPGTLRQPPKWSRSRAQPEGRERRWQASWRPLVVVEADEVAKTKLDAKKAMLTNSR
ncbi:unnamed protein product [Cyprideis torosa]|uniref:Cyclin-like domain-containing protein n=1 Tax=Cyprideis torosa TaxID=163714 RepID=A0A7R8W8J6_9CRUS|nr:unnamed protein product [Cyprideis torosa]CAG0888678.1 unnamed protein product [Cyprideis torosa]